MGSIVINGHLQHVVDFQKTDDDFHKMAMRRLREGRLREGQLKKKNKPVVHSDRKIGRNDPCPCGSGRKYKKCHGG